MATSRFDGRLAWQLFRAGAVRRRIPRYLDLYIAEAWNYALAETRHDISKAIVGDAKVLGKRKFQICSSRFRCRRTVVVRLHELMKLALALRDGSPLRLHKISVDPQFEVIVVCGVPFSYHSGAVLFEIVRAILEAPELSARERLSFKRALGSGRD